MSILILKLIANVAMLIDHIGLIILTSQHSYYMNFRLVGRLSFPIFIFLLSEGLTHSHSKKKYFNRLLTFAFISEIPYDFAFFYNDKLPLVSQFNYFIQKQNIFFTLALGVLFVIIIDDLKADYSLKNIIKISLLTFVAYYINSDYSFMGIIFIPSMYYGDMYFSKFINHSKLYIIFIFMFFLTYDVHYKFFIASIFSIPLIYFYNGTTSKYNGKILYYIYPLHLTILAFINIFFIA